MRIDKTLSGIALCLLSFTACTPMENLHPDIHGHRGCRGLLPENTLPAFLKATELGCDMLELDVVLSADDHVVVSHEPWMSSVICVDPNDEPIPLDKERSLNLYRMKLAEIQAYDCGDRAHPDFPKQKLISAHKPTLREVVEATDEYALFAGMVSPSYNIEIKSDPAWYGVYQPQPFEYANRIIREVDDLGINTRCIIQSFDPAILEVLHEQRPDLILSFLVENEDGLKKNLKRLSFSPQIYSPRFDLLGKNDLEKLREANIELVVWTVNAKKDIRRMLELGVDGIISDYPDRVIALKEGND